MLFSIMPSVPLVLMTTVATCAEAYQASLATIKYAIRTKYQADASERVRGSL